MPNRQLVSGGHASLQELLEYLHPETGVVDLAADGSLHGGGGGHDLEAGLGKEAAPLGVGGGQVVHVDASESLSAVIGEPVCRVTVHALAAHALAVVFT